LETFIRLVERSPVNRHEVLAFELTESTEGFVWVDVDLCHEPPRLVGTDGHEDQLWGSEALPNQAEVLPIAGIAPEVDAMFRAFYVPACPQSPVTVCQTAPGEVACRGAVETHTGVLHELPPVQFHDSATSPPAHKLSNPSWHKEKRVGMAYEELHAGFVQMVVVVVRDQHDMDSRELFRLERQGDQPAWSGKAHRACPRAEDGICKEDEGVELEQHGTVPKPKHA